MRVVIEIPLPDYGIAMSEVAEIVTMVAQQLPVTLDRGSVELREYHATWRIDDNDQH